MAFTVQYGGKEIEASQDADELYPTTSVEFKITNSGMATINKCLDDVYNLYLTHYPSVFRPTIALGKSNHFDARGKAQNKFILVLSGFLLYGYWLINKAFNEKSSIVHSIYSIHNLNNIKYRMIEYFDEYIILHELAHLWHGHELWADQYFVDGNGEVKKLTFGRSGKDNITQQVFELDADQSAIKFLVNVIFSKYPKDMNTISDEIVMLSGAMGCVFYLFGVTNTEKYKSESEGLLIVK